MMAGALSRERFEMVIKYLLSANAMPLKIN